MKLINNVVNIELTKHGRTDKIYHVTDIERLLETDNMEEYINNVSFLIKLIDIINITHN